MRSFLWIGVAIILLTVRADAASPKIVPTGDSITSIYWSNLPQAFNNVGQSVTVPDLDYGVAGKDATIRGGQNAPIYTGQTPFPGDSQPIDCATNVLTENPDVILFMLGTNDSYWDFASADNFNTYKQLIDPVFQDFSTFANSQGKRPTVVVSSVLPMNLPNPAPSGHAGGMDRIQNWYNPWLKQECNTYGFTFLDNFSAIQQVPNWQTTLLGADGIHPTAQGSQWLASQFAGAAVPEPSTPVLLGVGLAVFLASRFRRR